MHWHGPTGFVVREAREMVWYEKGRAHGREMLLYYNFNEYFVGA